MDFGGHFYGKGFLVKEKWYNYYFTIRVDTPVLTGRGKPVILVNFQWPKTGFFEAKKPVIFISKIPQFELIFAIFSQKDSLSKN